MTKGQKQVMQIARDRLAQGKTDGGNVRWWIGTEPEPEDRMQILITPQDAQKQRPHGDVTPFTVTDLLTGRQVTLRRADCGLGCQCALEEVTA